MMQTPKVRGNSSEVPLKVSPRAARQQLKPALDTNSPNSSNQKSRTPKEKSAATAEHRSPRGSVTELPKKSPSKLSQLESQIAELQLGLTKAKEQISSSETLKQQALRNAEESHKQVSTLTQELKDSKKRFQELEESWSTEFQKISEREQEWQSKYDALQIQHTSVFAALGSAMDEIQRLKSQLETSSQTLPRETKKMAVEVDTETLSLEKKLEETHLLVEDLKTQLKECKDSEANAHALANETLVQLETSRTDVDTLQLEGKKSTEAYNNLALELDESKAHIKSFEEHVSNLKTDSSNNAGEEHQMVNDELETLKEQLKCMNTEVDLLRSAQETAEVAEQIRITVQINSVSELMEDVKSESTRREAEMEVNFEALKSHTAELKANLIDKETELQSIIQDNEAMHKKIQDASVSLKEIQLKKGIKELKEIVMDLKANLMDKETEFQNILEENETLKSELNKKEMDIGIVNDSSATELNAARTAHKDTVAKLEFLKEEADRSSKRATHLTEQLRAAQAENAEMEAELRKIKVQSDQWRKAAEVAASMLNDASTGNFTERSGSLEGKCSPLDNRTTVSPYSEDLDEDSIRKKNGNVLKKFGLSWKKSQK